jgi:hypothetical protein
MARTDFRLRPVMVAISISVAPAIPERVTAVPRVLDLNMRIQ